jgi:hypothetical protein
MKKLILPIFVLFIGVNLNAQAWSEIKSPIKKSSLAPDYANVFFKQEFTLLDLMTNEPIYPVSKNGIVVYQIYFSSNEDPRPFYGEFTPDKLEKHLFYKFKDRESCMRFCDSKWHWSNGDWGQVVMNENNFSNKK